jgi:Tfp pilus assembly protein PilP
MKGRNKLFFNLLTFLLLVVIGIVGYKTRDADNQVKRWEAEIRRRQERGVEDPILRETVNKLEADLRMRLSETFDVKEDPLDLTRVIHTRKFLKKMLGGEMPETETRMRLSCTITGEKGPSAIIKYRGRSQVLSVGDKIGDYTVVSIGSNSIELRRGRELMKLITEKAPDTISEEENMFGPNGEDIPIIEVKQIDISGNS